MKVKFILTCIFFGALCLSGAIAIKKGLAGPLIVTMLIFGLLTILFTVSVFIEYNNQKNTNYGVITIEEVVARQGDGQNYPPSFKDSLHEGTPQYDFVESISHSSELTKLENLSKFSTADENKLSALEKKLRNLNSTLLESEISSLNLQITE